MTLTEFLLARITEDEDVAYLVRPDEYLSTRDARTLTAVKIDGYAKVAGTSGRTLAECRAKRMIIAEWMRFEDENRRAYGVNPVHSVVARALALPYADHPDYQQEWAA